MADVSINRVVITRESAAEFERLGARWLRGERERLPPEELLSRQLVRADDRPEYAVLSAWAGREAHERNEDGPAEREALRLAGGMFAAQPTQFTAEVLTDVRSPARA